MVEVVGFFGFDMVVVVFDDGIFSIIFGDMWFDVNGDSSLFGYVVYEWCDGVF